MKLITPALSERAEQILHDRKYRLADATIDYFDDERAESLCQSALGITLDLAKNPIDIDIVAQLLELAKLAEVENKIGQQFAGKRINQTEDRAVLHTLMRAQESSLPIFDDVKSARDMATAFTESFRNGEILGATDEALDTVVNIGIGGSDLGPQLLTDAFKQHIDNRYSIYYLSDVDDNQFDYVMSMIDLEKTLFVLCSKSFSTWETQVNGQRVIERLKEKVGDNWAQHYAGVAVDTDAMSRFGILPERQFKIWDFVGGRYSLWSNIGLSARLVLGNDIFDEFLAGGAAMDDHFKSTPLANNLPVLLALAQIWNINFLNHKVFITLPYVHGLKLFPDYQQQLEMESNGKSVDTQGNPVQTSTCPYIFGQIGLNAQHAFMQLVHQSQHNSYVEFIVSRNKQRPLEDDVAFRSFLAQSSALLLGTEQGTNSEKVCPGQRPSTAILLDEFSPSMLGKLIALYEHKVFVQSVMWQINAYDQFGVELGKKIATKLNSDSENDNLLDASTRRIIRSAK